jgi:hypothetical protein
MNNKGKEFKNNIKEEKFVKEDMKINEKNLPLLLRTLKNVDRCCCFERICCNQCITPKLLLELHMHNGKTPM